ncbi:MAG: 30S ribosomal protein S19 [Nanoarchaeota archaeon]|nr:30S ribosomal protein S19 [Nanoarchaeota archaeon]
MAKEFHYRGKTIEELKQMDLGELAKLLPARQRRSIKKGFTEYQKKLLKRIDLSLQGKTKKPIRTHCRDMIILPKMIGLTICIHQGKAFIPVTLLPESVGMYLGELVMTRQKVAHSAPGVGATRSSAAISVR